MDILISVVVPVYNVELYLEKCIKSILNQTFIEFELILVNDGSTDSSGKLCEEFVKKDPRISLITQKNSGLSAARNQGTKMAKAPFITYIDSDDYISKDYLKELFEFQKRYSADVVVANQAYVYENGKIVYRHYNNIRLLSDQEALEIIYYQKEFDTNACGKLFKTKLMKNNPFTEGILYEDFDLIYKLIAQSKVIVYNPVPLYFYLQRSASIMGEAFSNRKLVLINIAENHLLFIKKQYPEILNAVIRRYVYSNFHLIGRTAMLNEYKEITRKLRKNILKYRKNILINPKVSIKEKISVIILSFGIVPYKIAWKIFCVAKGKAV